MITRSDLREEGVTDRMITGMLGEGVLVRRHAAVFVLGAAPLSRRGIAYAALRAGGDDAVLSHRTAAWWRLLLPAFPGRIDIAVPRSRRGDPDLIRWHKPARLAPEDWEEHEGLRVTRVARTLLDLANDQPERLPKAVANAEFHRLLDVHEIQGAIGRASGHHGIRALRRALARPLPQLAKTRSDGEDELLLLIAHAGLPLPAVNAIVSSDLGLHECDLVWADHRLIVELDGDAAHGTRSQRRRDSRIANALARAGWHVIRISGHELATAPDDVLATIRAALARAEGPARGTSATK